MAACVRKMVYLCCNTQMWTDTVTVITVIVNSVIVLGPFHVRVHAVISRQVA